MSIPKYRICDGCGEQIGTPASPMVQITIGVFDGVSYNAVLPRWAWRLWAKFQPTRKSEDGNPGELEPVPVKHERCVTCAHTLLTEPDAHDVVTQREFRDEKRLEYAREVAAKAAAEAEALASRLT